MANPNIVSVSTIYGGNYGWALTNTLTTTLVTVDAEKLLKINRIVCTNIHATDAANLNLYVDGMGTAAANGLTPTGASATTYLAKIISVPSAASLVVTDTPIYLMEGDILKGGSSATSTLELFITYEVLDDA